MRGRLRGRSRLEHEGKTDSIMTTRNVFIKTILAQKTIPKILLDSQCGWWLVTL